MVMIEFLEKPDLKAPTEIEFLIPNFKFLIAFQLESQR